MIARRRFLLGVAASAVAAPAASAAAAHVEPLWHTMLAHITPELVTSFSIAAWFKDGEFVEAFFSRAVTDQEASSAIDAIIAWSNAIRPQGAPARLGRPPQYVRP